MKWLISYCEFVTNVITFAVVTDMMQYKMKRNKTSKIYKQHGGREPSVITNTSNSVLSFVWNISFHMTSFIYTFHVIVHVCTPKRPLIISRILIDRFTASWREVDWWFSLCLFMDFICLLLQVVLWTELYIILPKAETGTSYLYFINT